MDKQTSTTLVSVLGVIYLVEAAFLVVGAFMMFWAMSFMADFMAGFPGAPGRHTGAFQSMMTFMGVFVLGLAAVYAATGWGVYTRKPWARIAGIVLGIISLFEFPVGTAIGAFAIWLLAFEKTAIEQFEQAPSARPL